MERQDALPTPKQLARAQELGIAVTPGITSVQLSRLIRKAPASEQQKRYARELGITFDPAITTEEMKELLRDATPLRNKETIKARGFTAGDVLSHNGQTWLIERVWGYTHGRLTLRAATIKDGKVSTQGPAKVMNAFQFKDARKF